MSVRGARLEVQTLGHSLTVQHFYFVTANLSEQPSSFRLHLYTKKSVLSLAAMLLSFDKQNGERKTTPVQYYDRTLRLLIL